MMASSLRLFPSSLKTSGSLGMPRSSATPECVDARRRGVLDRAARDEEETAGSFDAIGLDDRQPVMPHRMIGELGAGRPGLRREIEHVGGVAFAGDGFGELVVEV